MDIKKNKINKSHEPSYRGFFINVFPYMLLNAQLLELDKFGSSGLQVESTSRFVGDTLLAGTHDERHEGGRLDLMDTNTPSKKEYPRAFK